MTEEDIREEIQSDVETKILKITAEMVDKETLTEDEAGKVNSLARKGEIDQALTIVEEKQEEAAKDELEFEEEEKQLFADAFSDSFEDTVNNVEEMKESLQNLEKGASRGDLKQYLYGENSMRTYKEIEAVFDAIDDFTSSGVSDKKIAKVLTAFGSNLTIKDTENMVSEIRAKVEE